MKSIQRLMTPPRAARIAAGVMLTVLSLAPAQAAKPPNIIVVLADDLGAKELSCYGNQNYQTPRLDRMAAEGVRFETFYAMPLCTPTRMALMTGQYGFRNGYLGMGNPEFTPLRKSTQRELVNHFTIGKLMKSCGYETAQVGKWQLSGALPTLIRENGFDEYCMWAYEHNLPPGVKHEGSEPGKVYKPSRYWYPSIVQNAEYRKTRPEDFGPDVFNQFAIDFATRRRDKPFFLYYTSVLTHQPRVETPDPQHPGQKWPAGLKSNLEYLDYLMGQLLDALKTHGLDDNTVVFFIGDNGTGGDGKATVTEKGARVPAIVRGAGVKRGVVTPALGDLTDIMPTLAALSGATLPSDVTFDGHSMLPVLRGETSRYRDWIYSHLDDGRLLRDERWLLEIDKGSQRTKFFDCGSSRDGSHYKDVTDSTEPEVLAARKRFDAVLATMPEPKPHPLENLPAGKKAKGAKKARNKKQTQKEQAI